jgi:hypothetical protein
MTAATPEADALQGPLRRFSAGHGAFVDLRLHAAIVPFQQRAVNTPTRRRNERGKADRTVMAEGQDQVPGVPGMGERPGPSHGEAASRKAQAGE